MEEDEDACAAAATRAASAAFSAAALAAAAAFASSFAMSSLRPPAVLSSWDWSASTWSLLSSRWATSLTAALRSASRAMRRSAISWRYTSAACAVSASLSDIRCIMSSCVTSSSKLRDANRTSTMPASFAL